MLINDFMPLLSQMLLILGTIVNKSFMSSSPSRGISIIESLKLSLKGLFIAVTTTEYPRTRACLIRPFILFCSACSKRSIASKTINTSLDGIFSMTTCMGLFNESFPQERLENQILYVALLFSNSFFAKTDLPIPD
ncbi:hypothetical protein SDC9_130920 [bioreactor metagenome]|uniref:Uncharacterized protein n=1 Tax=bioreactor metagenome TaxID=1076179 RepID=A0A645D3U6_9ZZZZ